MTEALWLETTPHENLLLLTGNEVDKINKPLEIPDIYFIYDWKKTKELKYDESFIIFKLHQ